MRLWISLILLTMTTPVYAQTLGSTSGASSTLDITNPASTTSRLITTPTVVAPGLAAAGVETCLGSAAGGLSLMGGGITFGATKVDEGCTVRLLARQLFAFGFQKAALALMCQEQRVAVAMYDAGSPCPAPPGEIAQRDHVALPPVNSFAQEEPTKPLMLLAQTEDQATPASEDEDVKPFTQDEQAMFDRASHTN
jgi:hypothetical protein